MYEQDAYYSAVDWILALSHFTTFTITELGNRLGEWPMTAHNITTPGETVPQRPPADSTFKRIFIGPHGLRAGWRLLIFVLLMIGISGALGVVIRLFGGQASFKGNLKQVTPFQLSMLEGVLLFYTAASAWVMSKIEGRKFGQYGLPWSQALRQDFWVGLSWGFLATSGTVLSIFLLHGVRITGPVIHGKTILTSVIAWT